MQKRGIRRSYPLPGLRQFEACARCVVPCHFGTLPLHQATSPRCLTVYGIPGQRYSDTGERHHRYHHALQPRWQEARDAVQNSAFSLLPCSDAPTARTSSAIARLRREVEHETDRGTRNAKQMHADGHGFQTARHAEHATGLLSSIFFGRGVSRARTTRG